MVLYPKVGVPLRMGLAACGLVLLCAGRVHFKTVVLAVSLWPFSGLGVTAGAHRLWTHGSYKPGNCMELLLLWMFATADQGLVINWALTHKMHHRYSDSKGDPHDRSLGFWHAHIGWVFAPSLPLRVDREDVLRCVSRYSRPVRLHDNNSLWIDPFCSLILPALLAWHWGDALGGLLVAGALRWFVVQHFTFLVNSMAHGERSAGGDAGAFDLSADTIGPRASFVVSLLALGEGWHDYHHEFPWDYAAAELDAWDQLNPTKVFIDTCHALGLCWDLRRCLPANQIARRRKLLAGQAKGVTVHDGDDREARTLGLAEVTEAAQEAELAKFEVKGWPLMRRRELKARAHEK